MDALLPTRPAPTTQLPHAQQQRSEDDILESNNHAPSAQPYVVREEEKKGAHVIELVSPPYSHHPYPAGKTSLIHLTVAHAVLPPALSNIELSGLNSSVVLFDPLYHFSVSFLVRTMLSRITKRFEDAGKGKDAVGGEEVEQEIKNCVQTSLLHVHIFRPTSWESLLSTLRSLKAYLFDRARHESTRRAVHSIVLEDADAFVPMIRNASTTMGGAHPLTTASAQLTHELEKLANLLSCAVITTSHSTDPSSYRPPLPLSWPVGMQTTRLAVRRVEVLKFASGISVEQAEQERNKRSEVVSKGRFEVRKVGQGRDGNGFVFRVGSSGAQVQRREG